MITLVALAVAFGVARLVIDSNTEPTMSVQDALDEQSQAPLVNNPEIRAEVGSFAPDVRLDYLDGGTQQLAEVAGRGTPVVLNFWGSYCAPCIKEMPALEEVSERFGDQLMVVGVDVVDSVEEGKKMVARTGVTYRNARDPKSDIAAVYGALSLPRTVFIDGDGTVVEMHNGELTVKKLTEMLTKLGLVQS